MDAIAPLGEQEIDLQRDACGMASDALVSPPERIICFISVGMPFAGSCCLAIRKDRITQWASTVQAQTHARHRMIGPTRAQQAKRVLECPPHRKCTQQKAAWRAGQLGQQRLCFSPNSPD